MLIPLLLNLDTAGVNRRGGHSGPKRRKKRKEEEPDIWPWPAQINRPPQGMVAPPKPSISITAAPRPLPAPSREMIQALASFRIPQTDRAALARIARMMERVRQEIEDEEALLMMGAFDDE